MKNKIIRTIFGAGIIAIASSASAEDSGRSVWEAIVDTLPAGVVSEENSSGSYLSDTWVGMKLLFPKVPPDCSFPPTRFIRDMHTRQRNATTKTVIRGAAVFRATLSTAAETAESCTLWPSPIPTTTLNRSWATAGCPAGDSAAHLSMRKPATPSV